MFHLQTGIHFKEVEILILIHHKFQGSGTIITDSLTGFHSNLQHFLPGIFLYKGRRRFLNHLLIPSLDRTFTLSQMNDITIFIPHNLYLNMMWVFYIFFDIDSVITKRSPGFRLRQTESRLHFLFGAYQTHPLPSTSGKCFQHDRITDFLSHLFHFLDSLHRRFCSGHNRKSCFTHNFTGFRLDSHFSYNVGTRTNKNHSFFFATTSKIRIFRQESVSRMNGGSGLFGNGQYKFRLQIGSIFG